MQKRQKEKRDMMEAVKSYKKSEFKGVLANFDFVGKMVAVCLFDSLTARQMNKRTNDEQTNKQTDEQTEKQIVGQIL